MSSYFSWLWSTGNATTTSLPPSGKQEEKPQPLATADHWQQIRQVGSNKDHFLRHLAEEEIAMNRYRPEDMATVWSSQLVKAPLLKAFLKERK